MVGIATTGTVIVLLLLLRRWCTSRETDLCDGTLGIATTLLHVRWWGRGWDTDLRNGTLAVVGIAATRVPASMDRFRWRRGSRDSHKGHGALCPAKNEKGRRRRYRLGLIFLSEPHSRANRPGQARHKEHYSDSDQGAAPAVLFPQHDILCRRAAVSASEQAKAAAAQQALAVVGGVWCRDPAINVLVHKVGHFDAVGAAGLVHIDGLVFVAGVCGPVGCAIDAAGAGAHGTVVGSSSSGGGCCGCCGKSSRSLLVFLSLSLSLVSAVDGSVQDLSLSIAFVVFRVVLIRSRNPQVNQCVEVRSDAFRQDAHFSAVIQNLSCAHTHTNTGRKQASKQHPTKVRVIGWVFLG